MTSSPRFPALGFAAAIAAALAGPVLSLAHGAEHAEERHRALHQAAVQSSAASVLAVESADPDPGHGHAALSACVARQAPTTLPALPAPQALLVSRTVVMHDRAIVERNQPPPQPAFAPALAPRAPPVPA